MKPETRQYAGDSHTGLRRGHNEDCFGAYPELGLWLVADGVGGHSDGQIASNIVQLTIFERVSQGDSLLDAVKASHQAVLSAIATGLGSEGMGSTVIAVVISEREFELCWVGDSRAYGWNGKLARLSRDHNRVSELLNNKLISGEQAQSHPERHGLTQALGVSANMELSPGHVRGPLPPDQYILLCSDGLTDELSDSLIAHLLADHITPRAQVDALISAALDAGGRDNITAIVIGCESLNKVVAHAENLESIFNSRRSTSASGPNSGKFPTRALLLVGAIVLAAVLVLL